MREKIYGVLYGEKRKPASGSEPAGKRTIQKTDSPFAGLLQKGWGTKSGERSFCCPFGEMGQRRCGL